MDLERNWGNVVVLQHAPGLFSLVAHLARGSVKVREGQHVRRGDVLGACGSSGRSPRPHLHFQLQGAAALGSPTLPCRFSDAVLRHEDEEAIDAAACPDEGDVARNVEPDAALAAAFAFEPGSVIALRLGGAVEHIECDVDLLGQRILRSREGGAILYFARGEGAFTAYDVLGDARSALHLVRAALGRVPFDGAPARFRDHLPARWTRWPLLKPLRDLVSPFAPGAGLEMAYRARREGGRLVVTGESIERVPSVRTKAVLSPSHGLESVEVHAGGRHLVAERVDSRARVIPAPRAASVFVSRLLASLVARVRALRPRPLRAGEPS
jgi:hypothetical protein